MDLDTEDTNDTEEPPYIPDFVLRALSAVHKSAAVNMMYRGSVINVLIQSDIDGADDTADWCRMYPDEYAEGLRQMAELEAAQ